MEKFRNNPKVGQRCNLTVRSKKYTAKNEKKKFYGQGGAWRKYHRFCLTYRFTGTWASRSKNCIG
jgi:hypothetical protein